MKKEICIFMTKEELRTLIQDTYKLKCYFLNFKACEVYNIKSKLLDKSYYFSFDGLNYSGQYPIHAYQIYDILSDLAHNGIIETGYYIIQE